VTKRAKNVDEEINYFFYTNSNKYSDFINDPISGENMKSSSINRRIERKNESCMPVEVRQEPYQIN